MAMTLIDDDTVEAFARDGVVVARSLLDAGFVAELSQAAEKMAENAGVAAAKLEGDADSSTVYEASNLWREVEEFERASLHPALAGTAAALMDSPTARFFSDHIQVVRPGATKGTPWHQDQPHYNIDGRGVTAWIALDRLSKAYSPEFWAGSHLGPWRLSRAFVAQAAEELSDRQVASVPEIDSDRSAFDVRQWALEIGDVVFFSTSTLYSIPAVSYDQSIRTLSLIYIASNARYGSRPWPTVFDLPAFEEMVDGDDFDSDLFPQVWPATSG